MTVLTPEPLDGARARTDIGYFAEKYLDIPLNERQINFVDQILKGTQSQDIYMMNSHEKQQVIDVSIAVANWRGIPIIVHNPKEDFIDGEAV